MDTKLKRLLSLAVALVMVIGLMPWNAASVYATDEEVSEETEPSTETEPVEEETGHVHICEAHSDCTAEWVAWDGKVDSLADGGHYYLTAGATMSTTAKLTSGQKITICLNGQTLNAPASSRAFQLGGGAELTIVDCTATGEGDAYTAGVINITRAAGTRGEFVYGDSSVFTLWDGIVEGNNNSALSAGTKDGYGGLIQALGTQIVNIRGGWLRNYDAYRGGAIYVTGNAEVNMYGGYITGCSATRGNAVCVDAYTADTTPVFHMHGGTISGNGTATSGRGIDTVVARGSKGNAAVYIYDGATISNNVSGSANSGLAATNIGKVYVKGGSITGNSVGISLANKGYAEISGGTISANGTGIVLTGTKNTEGVVTETPAVIMSAGTVSANTKDGVDLFVSATFTMSGGAISDHSNGYGVFQNSGATTTFNLEGGTISGNKTANQGAGVRCNAGNTFNMSSGYITGNISNSTTGGVGGVRVAGTFTMTGGEISGNTCPKYEGEDTTQVLVTGEGVTAELSGTAKISKVDATNYALLSADGAAITVSGGTYNSDVTAYLTEGYVQNSLTGEVVQSCAEHTPSEEGTVTQEPTCTVAGEKTYYCTVCGTVISTEIVPAGEHEYDRDNGVVTAPTCTEAGYTTYKCKNCDETLVEEGDEPLGHSYVDGVCTVCGERDPEAECAHEYLTDCDKICNICGEESRPEADHAEATHVARVEPTCYTDGNLEYWYCEKCGAAWLDESCTLNTNLKAVVLPMGHGEIIHVEAKASTCYVEGNIEHWYCSVCGQAWLDADCTLNTNLLAVKLPTLAPVVSIGDVNYGSLKAAIDAANATEEADTITILTDITETEMLEVTSEIVITADKAVTVTTTYSGYMISVTSGKLTVTGLSEDAPITLKAGDATSRIVYNKNATTELNCVVIDGALESTTINGIYAEGGETTAKSVSIQKGGVGIYVWKGTVNLDDVTISGVSSYGIKNHGTVNITNTVDPDHALTIENSNDHAIDIASHTGSSGKVISNLTGDIEGKYPIVIDTTIKSSGRGILVRAGGELAITNVSIQNVEYYGLELLAATAVASISNATIASKGYAIKTVADSSLTVSNVTVQKCGVTATNILGNQDGTITYTHSYDNGVCTVCGEIEASITLATASLNLLDQVCIIYEATDDQIVTNDALVAERGVLLYASETAAQNKDATQLNETIVLEKNDAGKYVGQSQGIDARDMAESQFAVAYLKLTDGTYIYGTENDAEQIVEFSPLIYCQKAVADETISAEVKNLCRALMHYGAAAQVAQYGMTDGLMNAEFGEFAYDETVLGKTVFSANTRTTNGMKLKSVTMALKGAISYIVKFTADGVPSDKTPYAEYTLLGKTETVELVEGSDGKLWATISGVAAKDLDATLTVKPYYLDENEEKVYGGELVFSGYEYTRIVTKNAAYDEKVKDLAMALAMYVSYADAYAKTVEGQ